MSGTVMMIPSASPNIFARKSIHMVYLSVCRVNGCYPPSMLCPNLNRDALRLEFGNDVLSSQGVSIVCYLCSVVILKGDGHHGRMVKIIERQKWIERMNDGCVGDVCASSITYRSLSNGLIGLYRSVFFRNRRYSRFPSRLTPSFAIRVLSNLNKSPL